MRLQCPVIPSHTLVQVAPDVHQCPSCGAGPNWYWALTEITIRNRVVEALCVSYRHSTGEYTITDVCWESLGSGTPVAGTFDSSEPVRIPPADYDSSPLPAIGKGRIEVRAGAFSSTTGEKHAPKAGRTGRSARGRARKG